MARRSLRPHLNQIRGWVRQGRTDAWIAHQLEATVKQIDAFKRENDLAPDEPAGGATAVTDFDDEIDLRAEDDALIAAQIEAEQDSEPEAEPSGADGEAAESERPARRRSRRGGRSRRSATSTPLEGTFDHGEEGYGLWLDPAIQDDPVYAEHWAGHRPVEVTIEEDRIVIRRAAPDEDDE